MNPAKRREIFSRLRAANPHPTTELEFHSPFELLIAVLLSAQATDVSVNAATRQLFPVAGLHVFDDSPHDVFRPDRGRYPNSLGELVSERYLRALPVDPITERSDTWQAVAPSANEAGESEAGELYDIKSGAPGTARDGSAYADW